MLNHDLYRIILPIKRFSLPESQTSVPIPTLSDRQFVVSKSKLTSIEEKRQRELFWYREELFKRIKARWREVQCFFVSPIYLFDRIYLGTG